MLAELIERLEKADEGSLELDKAILMSFGFTWRGMNYWHHDDRTMWRGPTFFTRSLDAAVALAERVLPDVGWSVATNRIDRRRVARLWTGEIDDGKAHAGASPAIALCLAILKAMER